MCYKILLIEDDALLAESLSELLRDTYQVTVSEDGGSAMRLIESQQVFDVIICDLVMPEMGGVALLSLLQTKWPSIIDKFILTSGYSEREEIENLHKNYRVPILSKPYPIQKLLTLIAQRLEPT